MSKEKEFSGGSLGGATEVAFSFDTTGSMQPCIASVREKIEKTCEELFSEIPGLKVGLIAHGDYCDGDKCMNVLPLTDDKGKIFSFIRDAPNTGGGDAPECYEYALQSARDLGWSDTEKSGRALVLIGDDEPHKVGDVKGGASNYVKSMAMPEVRAEPSVVEGNQQNVVDVEWRQELGALLEMGVKVYPMQCLYHQGRTGANRFWSEIAEICDSALIRLDDFSESSEALTGVAMCAAGSEAFEKYSARCATKGASMSTKARNRSLSDEAKKYDKMRGEDV